MREPLIQHYLLYQVLGITPAHAGTTILLAFFGFPSKDHPRSCGNHELRLQALRNSSGSPPLLREPQYKKRSGLKSSRITPAHAGTTLRVTLVNVPLWDHPSSCGNHSKIQNASLVFWGSPPLMREPQCKNAIQTQRCRITPAHAGTTIH